MRYSIIVKLKSGDVVCKVDDATLISITRAQNEHFNIDDDDNYDLLFFVNNNKDNKLILNTRHHHDIQLIQVGY